MKLQPRYCRTCGTRILVKNVCHNCGSDPLTGENYCYDCGALTPEATKCLNCGASFQKKISSSSAIIIASALLLTIAVAAYIVSQSDSKSAKTDIAKTDAPNPEKADVALPDTAKQKASETQTVSISNTIPAESPVKKEDSVKKDTVKIKPIAAIKDTIAKTPPKAPQKDTAASQKMSVNLFSSAEIRDYKPGCTYFENKQKGQVLFFTANGSGYIKVNDKIYPLKRTQKGNDVSKFSGGLYDVVIEIKGLTGSDKEWLASGMLTVKDQFQKTTAHYKIYSSCIGL